jgi:hypothetical protein
MGGKSSKAFDFRASLLEITAEGEDVDEKVKRTRSVFGREERERERGREEKRDNSLSIIVVESSLLSVSLSLSLLHTHTHTHTPPSSLPHTKRHTWKTLKHAYLSFSLFPPTQAVPLETPKANIRIGKTVLANGPLGKVVVGEMKNPGRYTDSDFSDFPSTPSATPTTLHCLDRLSPHFDLSFHRQSSTLLHCISLASIPP